MKHVVVVFGTRPEAIKTAPVVETPRARPTKLLLTDWVTAQHCMMLDHVLALFGIVQDVELALMKPGPSLADLTSEISPAVDGVLTRCRPDVVRIDGDTTTSMATSPAAFYRQIPVGHVEAGLRSGMLSAPFPEEMSRVFIDQVAPELLAPTPRAEDADADRNAATGSAATESLAGLDAVARDHPDVTLGYPVQLSPSANEPVRERSTTQNSRFIDPVDGVSLVRSLDPAEIVLTASGGIPEEAAAPGKPALVVRDVTERPEHVDAGAGLLVGPSVARAEAAATRLLEDAAHCAAMRRPWANSGDGRSSGQIAARRSSDVVVPWSPTDLAARDAFVSQQETPS